MYENIQFETYSPKNAEHIVLISKNHISMTNSFASKLNSNFVELAYNKDHKIIRIKPSEAGIKINKSKIGAAGFFKHHEIDIKARVAGEFDIKTGCIFIKL